MDDSSDNLNWWSARRVAAAIAARTLSAREYLDVLLERVERLNPAFNLVVTIDERARQMAAEADAAVARGEPLGSLHGVAMTVKDCMLTAGLRTTAGLPGLRGYIPREDAAAVAKLRLAGAVIFGKTNVPAGGGDVQAYNDVFGVARNPWNPLYSPGGSSGGAAGAVAAGLTPLELGSDVAGSIRIPAAACGVFGHKPSFGIVPMHGHAPPAPYKPGGVDMSVIGPLARNVADLREGLLAVAGPQSWEAPAWRLSLPPERPVQRVAVWFDDPYCPVDPAVKRALWMTAGRLAAECVPIEEARPRGVSLEESDQVFRRLLAAVTVHEYSAEDVERHAADGSGGSEMGGQFVAQRYRDWALAQVRRDHLRLKWAKFFTRYDAILLPVTSNLAIRHDHRPFEARSVVVDGVQRPYWDQIIWAGLTGVSYLPSTVVPVCLDPHGIPIGLAVVGPYLGDLTTLALAGRLSGLLPPLGPPPLEPVRLPAAPDGCATTTAAVRPSPHTTGDPSTCPTKSN